MKNQNVMGDPAAGSPCFERSPFRSTGRLISVSLSREKSPDMSTLLHLRGVQEGLRGERVWRQPLPFVRDWKPTLRTHRTPRL